MPEARRSTESLRAAVLDRLAEYVSRPELRHADGDVLLRDYGLDSFGTFEFIVSLEQHLHIAIPDRLFDARACRSVDGIVQTLAVAGRVSQAGDDE